MDDKELKEVVTVYFNGLVVEEYDAEIENLVKWCKKYLNLCGNYVEK